MNFAYILTQVGNFGRYQCLLLVIFLIPVSILSSLQTGVMYLFLTPDHWCSVQQLSNFSNGEQHRFIRPKKVTNNGYHYKDSCSMYDINYDDVARALQLPSVMINKNHTQQSMPMQQYLPVKECDEGWVYDRSHIRESAVTEYDLVCDRRERIESILDLRKFGSLIGTPILAIISDRYGRKIAYLIISLIFIISTLSPLLLKHFTAFQICQFIGGIITPVNLQIALVLTLELVGTAHRGKVSAYLWIAYTLGFCVEAIVASYMAHWIWITVINAAATMPFILLWKFIPESPEWLVIRQQYETACDRVETMMRINKKKIIPRDLLMLQLQKMTKHKLNDEEESSSSGESIIKYVKNGSLRQIWIIITFCFITNALTREMFNATKIVFNNNQYINYSFVMLIDLPSILIAWYFMQRRIGRRWSNCLLNLVSGITLLVMAFTSSESMTKIIALSILGKLSNKASLIITYQQAIEINPTSLRCFSLASSSTIGNLLAIVITLIYSPEKYGYWLPMITMCALCLTSCVLLSFLPESLNENLPHTITSSETLIKEMNYTSLAKRKYEKVTLPITISKWNIYETSGHVS